MKMFVWVLEYCCQIVYFEQTKNDVAREYQLINPEKALYRNQKYFKAMKNLILMWKSQSDHKNMNVNKAAMGT